MAQHTLDLSDLTPDSVDMTIPFVGKDGKVVSRKITIVDPKTAIVLGIERISQEEEAYAERIKKNEVTAKEAVTFIRRKVFLILSQGNEDITEEEVNQIPANALTAIMKWFNDYMAGNVFLEDSPNSKPKSTSGASKGSSKKKATR